MEHRRRPLPSPQSSPGGRGAVRATGASGVAGESNRGRSPLLRPCFPGTVGADSVRDSADNAVGVMRPTDFPRALGAGFKSALSPALSRKRERGPFGVGGEFGVILLLRTPPRHSRERGNPVTGGSRASSLLRRARPLLLWILDFQRNSRAHRSAPSEGRAKPALRRSCDMDVARAPMGYRDVPSGRASVAGEFVRVARLYRARMRGKPFWFLLWRLTKGTRPRGRNKTVGQTRSGAETPKPRQLGFRVRGNDGD
ncbi:hypothetical protein J2T41_000336 [Pseudomonas citronellolis]|nr:hypothetical protein [Pseudomonas citronellolis]MCP1663662.1 hypothetical protein [Pseudomonas citronellolis]MCP1696036.1 hypothetical protein [Pseudomonas citronellolis]MCP1701527.1 hypothetical protein [Pseudomonas citronellolis]MCP1795448.1 hypothetical protein [Pseudomonas citronellolis]